MFLGELPVNERDAERIAYDEIRNRLGTIPSIGKSRLEGTNWIVPIIVKFPRVIFDETRNVPKKVRFMNFGELAEIKIDSVKGEIIEFPRFYELQSRINTNIEKVKTVVEKALVKVGSKKFSILPLAEHMHTPILDIISWILLNDKLELPRELSSIGEFDKTKYLQNIDILEKTGLLRKEGNLILPGNPMIEIETKGTDTPTKLFHALSYFFEKGYDYIDSIRQVLGPHLTLSGYCYEQSLEYGEIVPINYETISSVFFDVYRQQYKMLKLPRYLIQLQSVGLLEEKTIHSQRVWLCNQEIFDGVTGEEEILAPIRQFIHNE
jgi:hypothetical protein